MACCAGTGYDAARLSQLVASAGQVVTHRHRLRGDAGGQGPPAGSGHHQRGGDLRRWCWGLGPRGSHDGIIVTAGGSDLAPAWVGQFLPGGRLAVPLSTRGEWPPRRPQLDEDNSSVLRAAVQYLER